MNQYFWKSESISIYSYLLERELEELFKIVAP